MGARFSVGGLSTGDMSLVSGGLGNVLRLADFFTSRSYHVGHIFTQVLNTQSMLAELGFSENE